MVRLDGFILSYLNPDTDGVCSSLALSEFLSKTEKKEFVPIMSGKISAETSFVLETAGIDLSLLCYNYPYDPKNYPVILVDTHQLAQLPHLVSSDNVIEIWDHHPDGSDFKNANVNNFSIGAIASKIIEKMADKGYLDQKYAILLGSAVISNTLNFTAPSTTQYDREMMQVAGKYFEFDEIYVKKMLQQRDSVLSGGLHEALISDMKRFMFGNRECAISQLELCYHQVLLNDNNLNKEIKLLIMNEGFNFYVCNIIDILERKSYLICGDSFSSEIISSAFNKLLYNGIFEFDKILLRKTDLVPVLKRIFEK